MLPDPKSQTLTQLRAQLAPTKRDALIALNGGDKISASVVTFRKDGQAESQVETIRDVETNALMSTMTTAWTYYEKEKGVPVDTITIIETDASGKEIGRKAIKHYTDGRQPQVVP
jgi:hypothetical protein